MKIRSMFAAACAAIGVAAASPVLAHGNLAETVHPVFEQSIPNIPGKRMIAVEVGYEPGKASLPHTHAKSSFIFAYVLSGEIESQVNGSKPRVYKAGESWFEPPNATHSISRNASKTTPAKLLAVFVLDEDDKQLTTPIK